MRTMHRLLGVVAATVLFAGQAIATPVLPEGTTITSAPTSLLGYDVGANDYFAGGVSAVNDRNIEFLTDDFALALDFRSDGLLRLFDNLGSGDDLFNYTLQFSFAGSSGGLAGIQLLDVSSLTGGELLFTLIDHDTFELALHDVTFAPGFAHADLGLLVGEPSMLVLLAFGIVVAYAARRRRARSVRNMEVGLTSEITP